MKRKKAWKINPKYKTFIQYAITDLLSYGVQVLLVKRDSLYIHREDRGEFDADSNTLKCIIEKDTEQWMMAFVHEYCHFRQWVERPMLFSSDEQVNQFYEFLYEKRTTISRKALQKGTRSAIRTELDCEKRTVKQIEKWKLPIDISNYIKTSNAYIYSYAYALALKLSLRGMKISPSMSSPVINAMPDYFLDQYIPIPDEYAKLITKHCY